MHDVSLITMQIRKRKREEEFPRAGNKISGIVIDIIVKGIESITSRVDLIPITIGKVRLPTDLSPFRSAISPKGPKIKKKAKKNKQHKRLEGRRWLSRC